MSSGSVESVDGGAGRVAVADLLSPGLGAHTARAERAETRVVSAPPAVAQVQALYRRELSAYLLSPMSYLVWAVFLIASGYLFATSVRDGGPATLNAAFTSMTVLLLFVAPLLTMRLIAEELRLGTLEVLLTDPVGEATIIIAKYGAALTFFVVMLLPTLAYPIILRYVAAPDTGPILGGYAGILLLGALFLSVGLLMSAIMNNQIAAAAAAFTIVLIFWLLDQAATSIGPGRLQDTLEYLSAFTRFATFRRGILDTRSVIYCVTLIAFFLFASVRALGLRRIR